MTHRGIVLSIVLLALVAAQGCPKAPEVEPPALPQTAEPADLDSPVPVGGAPAEEPTDETADEPTEEPSDDAAATDETTGETDGVALVSATCTACHDLARVKAHDSAEESWAEIVDEMKGKAAGKEGKEIADEDAATILAFLETEGATDSLPDPEPTEE